jgi:hypothetical protein
MLRLIVTLIVTLCVPPAAAEAGGQPGPGAPGGTQRPGLPGGRMQWPPRDAREAPPTGTSIIRGRVVASDTGSPIRRVQVRAFSGEFRDSRMASTDAQGRFELRDLPAGRWELSASKAGFVSLRYGQRRPFEPGRPIELGDGETMTRADFVLPRGAAMTGRIVDEFGDPVAGARVNAMRYQSMQGQRRLTPTGQGDQTDDTGAFRIYGLPPGDYYVSASLQSGRFMGEDSSDRTSYAPTYFPGSGNVAEAQRVSIRIGEELPNVSFALLPTKAVRVSGTVVDSRGQRVSSGFVMLQDASSSIDMFMERFAGRVRPDGSFIVSNVTPGAYTITVNSGFGGGDDNETATASITVGNDDLPGINLVTSRGSTVVGTIVAAEGSAGTLNPAGVTVFPQPVQMNTMMMGSRPARVESDGSFKVGGLSGRRVFRVNGLPNTWMLQRVLLNGQDITDTGVEFKGTEEVSGLQILVTDRVTELNGKVTNQKGEPTRDYTVVVFPEDSDKWTHPSRYLRSARADQEGLFKIRALPPDVQYYAVAVDYIEEGQGGDPEFLREMVDRATRFTIASGELKALDLKLLNR